MEYERYFIEYLQAECKNFERWGLNDFELRIEQILIENSKIQEILKFNKVVKKKKIFF